MKALKMKITWERIGLLVALPLMFAVASKAQERIGKLQQQLVGGSVVDAAKQEEFGLLGYSDGSGVCSASLLRNGWAITAAHCVDQTDAQGNFIPDPKRPGQNKLNPIGNMTLTATWKTTQVASVVRVETFRPYDIALIQVNKPFRVGGSTTAYNRTIFQDGQFPSYGQPVGTEMILFGQGISKFATMSGGVAVPSVNDGLYRVGYVKPNYTKDERYWYPSVNGQMLAGGDSGGPSFAWASGDYALVGVHSEAQATRLPGKDKKGWTWVTGTTEAADAPVAPVWDKILPLLGPPPPAGGITLTPPAPGFIGTFGRTPPNYQPIWLYGISPNGDLMWYRKDTNAAAWQGPKKVGTGWNKYKDVIPAGGNRFYALTTEGKLLWFQHDGFNDGSNRWTGPVEVASNWAFTRIFSGGDGIVYGMRSDRTLLWTRNRGGNHGASSWEDFKVVSKGFNPAIISDIFSTGKGAIYMIRKDILPDRLLFMQHDGYATGEAKWPQSYIAGVGWNSFQQIVPCGDGVMLAISPDGKISWYHHRGLVNGKVSWEAPVLLGTGWQDFTKVIAIIPDPPPTVH